jgi:acetylornithine deacetylase/succinyl-diaminopimelate desuccinylase-like protein
MESTIAIARSYGPSYVSDLKEFLAIPTISAQSERLPDMKQGAEWLSRKFTETGLENVDIIPTGGHPIVYGEWLKAGERRNILVYGHYDVQPVDPISNWITPPFEPTVRDNYVFARGASDMKANGLAVLGALQALIESESLRSNVKVIFEGEDEIGSPHLGEFIQGNRSKLKCDLVLSADALMTGRDLPALIYGVRGLLYVEIWVHGPQSDLHSGEFGGAVHNPAQVLCELVAGMHNSDGRVTLPRFYDQVRVLSLEERETIAKDSTADEAFEKDAGVKKTYGEKNYTTLERIGARPTLEINGFLSGYAGEGPKAVLPSKAMAKISMRLVPHQDPADVEKSITEYISQHAPQTVNCQVKTSTVAAPALVDRSSFGMLAASTALERTFGTKPIFRLYGGAIPLVSLIKSNLGVETVMLGFSSPDDGYHAYDANERFYLPNYYRGIETYIRFFEQI